MGKPFQSTSVFNRTIPNNFQATDQQIEETIEALDSVQAFYDDLQEGTGIPVSDQRGLRVFYPYAYDATFVLLDSIERAGQLAPDGSLVIGRQALARQVRSTVDFPGVTGPVTIDAQGNRR